MWLTGSISVSFNGMPKDKLRKIVALAAGSFNLTWLIRIITYPANMAVAKRVKLLKRIFSIDSVD